MDKLFIIRSGSKKSQAAFEYMLILAVMIGILVLIFSVTYDMLTSTETKIRHIKAQDIVDELSKAAELVYEEGYGAKTKVYIDVPTGVEDFYIGDNKIFINISLGSDTFPIYHFFDFNVDGNLTTDDGYLWVNVTSEGNFVNITA